MTAPIGGELTSSIEMEQMLVSDLTQTVGLIRDSHTTFLGPKIADAQFADGYDAVLMNMGYRLWISDMKLSNILTGGIKVELTWQNSGVAPMYADWPVHLQVVDDEQNHRNGRCGHSSIRTAARRRGQDRNPAEPYPVLK